MDEFPRESSGFACESIQQLSHIPVATRLEVPDCAALNPGFCRPVPVARIEENGIPANIEGFARH
jgi:hypothetical protein